MAEEDDIDVETLQAQIDLSLSFTHNLVSSWVTPSYKTSASSSQSKNLEAELKDYMRRPPRLGVGAALPEGGLNTSKEAAKLKGQLLGKRSRQNEREPAQTNGKGPLLDDDDEEESRAGAIRTKTRADPFDVGGKKKKKATAEVNGVSMVTSESPQGNTSAASGSVMHEVESSAACSDAATPSQRKKKKKKKGLGAYVSALGSSNPFASTLPDLSDAEVSSTLLGSSAKRRKIASVEETPNRSGDPSSPTIPTISKAPPYVDNTPPPSSQRSSNTVIISNGPTPDTRVSLLHRPSSPVVLTKHSVLNLDGPPAVPSDDELDEPSPSKKRRKRKKKKRHSMAVTVT